MVGNAEFNEWKDEYGKGRMLTQTDEIHMRAAWDAGIAEIVNAYPVLKSTAQKDRHYICQIGKLFWGDDKQCYAADAVYRKVSSLYNQIKEALN